MSKNNWYETSNDMLMPLPLTESEVNGIVDDEVLTEEQVNDNARGRYPSITLPNNTSITVIVRLVKETDGKDVSAFTLGGVKLEGDFSYRYIGYTVNQSVYNSTAAPSEAGIYFALATFSNGTKQDNPTHYGIGFAAMLIMPDSLDSL